MFYSELEKLCAERNTSPTALVLKLGLSSSKVTAWKNGSLPKESVILDLADALGVHPSSFWGAFPNERESLELEENEMALLSTYRKLDHKHKIQLLGRAYDLLDEELISENGKPSSAAAG